jgi:hypothetical protein
MIIGSKINIIVSSMRRKRKALPKFLIKLMWEYPSWSKKGLSDSSLSSSNVNIYPIIKSLGMMSSWVKLKITLFILDATPGIVIEMRFKIIIELIALSIPQRKERHDPRKKLKIKLLPNKAKKAVLKTFIASSVIYKVSSDI